MSDDIEARIGALEMVLKISLRLQEASSGAKIRQLVAEECETHLSRLPPGRSRSYQRKMLQHALNLLDTSGDTETSTD